MPGPGPAPHARDAHALALARACSPARSYAHPAHVLAAAEHPCPWELQCPPSPASFASSSSSLSSYPSPAFSLADPDPHAHWPGLPAYAPPPFAQQQEQAPYAAVLAASPYAPHAHSPQIHAPRPLNRSPLADAAAPAPGYPPPHAQALHDACGAHAYGGADVDMLADAHYAYPAVDDTHYAPLYAPTSTYDYAYAHADIDIDGGMPLPCGLTAAEPRAAPPQTEYVPRGPAPVLMLMPPPRSPYYPHAYAYDAPVPMVLCESAQAPYAGVFLDAHAHEHAGMGAGAGVGIVPAATYAAY